MIFSSIIIVLGLLAGLLMLWRVPRAVPVIKRPDAEDHDLAARVSVIIPAYNEARRISPLLASLQTQDVQPGELWVVDDGSTDDTAAIAGAAGARVMQPDPSARDWVGKSRACWSGARAASGDWLLFLDADTRLDQPDSLRRILRTYRQLGGHGGVSFQPYHRVVRRYESLSVIFNIIVMAGMSVFTPWGMKLRSAGFFGPCLICSREDYMASGGHAAVRAEIMDDLALGQLFRKRGKPVFCYGGRDVISFRMYPEGFASLFEGWTKNFGSAAPSTHPLVFAMILLWICSGFSVLTLLIKSIGQGQTAWLAVAAVSFLLYVVLMLFLGRACGHFHLSVLIFYPVLLIFFTLLFLWSLVLTKILHTVKWRGRKIKL